MLELSDLNIAAIGATWIISLAVGSFWYSPIGFGRLWSRLSGVDMMNMPKDTAQKAILSVAIASLIQVFALAIVVRSLHAQTVTDGLGIGVFMWAGFVAATTVGNNAYLRMSWKFWWLNASFFLVIIPINAVILSIW